MSINTAADQKGAEPMAQPDPDPGTDLDRATAVSSSADGVNFTEDMPTICDGNPSPMEDSDHDEDIAADAAQPLRQRQRNCSWHKNALHQYTWPMSQKVLLQFTRVMLRQHNIPRKEPCMPCIRQEHQMHPESSQRLQENPSPGLPPSLARK